MFRPRLIFKQFLQVIVSDHVRQHYAECRTTIQSPNRTQTKQLGSKSQRVKSNKREKSNRPTFQVIFPSLARRGLPQIKDLAVNPVGEKAHSHLGLGLVVIVILLHQKVLSEVPMHAVTFPHSGQSSTD